VSEYKRLGKITRAEYGQLHDREYLFGLYVELGGDSWGVTTTQMNNLSPECKWGTTDDKAYAFLGTAEYVNTLLESAKCHYVSELKGKPVEATFDGNLLKHFRILTEVL
jgi:hypothetical protein